MTSTNAPTKTEGAAPAAGAGTQVPWEELVTAALLGTERRRPPVPDAGRGAPAALLDAAAAGVVWRRAGLRPAQARPGPAPVGPDPRPALPPAAAGRLAMLLADRQATGGRRGTTPDLKELLPQWLATANARGYAAPPELLPALLDAARGRSDLRPQALAFAGPRARWLAALNPDWKFALRAGAAPARAGEAPDDPAVRQRQWDEGLFSERVALLSALRSQEPSQARELLEGTWSTERAEDRLMFLDSLRFGLEDADEPFLERALADRSRNVRALAAELLSALPGSALAARMAERTLGCVTLEDRGGAPVLVIEPPRACDAAMERDGVIPKPPSGRGERSWWFGQLVEATPLGVWPERFGGRTPARLVALGVAGDWGRELHAAWCRAAVRQRDAEWSRALLDEPGAAGDEGEPPVVSLAERSRLLAALPARERAEWVAGFIAAHGLSEAFQLLGGCSVPWPQPLGGVVVDALNIARDSGSYPWSFSGVMGLAERCLDPALAPRLEALTAIQEDGEDTSPGAGTYWSEAFQRLTSTLRLRAAMHTELTRAPAGGGDGDAADGRAPARIGTTGADADEVTPGD